MEKTIKTEGPLSQVKGDSGGLTKYGISKSFLEQLTGGPVSAAFVLGLDANDAREIYRTHFWYKPKIHRIPDDKLREIVFDQAVNRSPFSAVLSLQRAINAVTSGTRIEVDGILGPATIDAILAVQEKERLIKEFVLDCQLSYVRIVEAEMYQVKFLRGWLTRAWNYLN